MERKIGEEFDYNGVTFVAVEANDVYSFCDGCYFEHMDCIELKVNILGFCFANNRKDGKSVAFKKVK